MPVDVDLFTPGGIRARDRLLFVGRLLPQKGMEHLLRALASLPGHVTLDAVGDGPDAQRLRNLASELGVSGRVTWRGPQPQPELVELYRAATAVVMPSVDEGLGLVAVEAHLCETPVVAFDSGGLRDVVTDGDNGLLVRPMSSDALAAALRSLLDHPDQGATLGRRGRMTALARFAPAAVARKYAAIYEDAINHFRDRQS
jgi:glycosyltransferase involved in cell wall biosynthesis